MRKLRWNEHRSCSMVALDISKVLERWSCREAKVEVPDVP